MQPSHALPFDFTAESVSAWLASIDQLFLAEKINSLNGVLGELTSAAIEKNTLFLLLDNLTESVLLLAKLLEHNAKRPDYPPDKARKWKTAAQQLPKKLSFIYAQLANENGLPDTQRTVCLYRAMQILCLLNKRSALFHEAPDLSLWKKFSELYLLAEGKQWLTLGVDDRVAGLSKLPTPDAIAKHALLFQGCLPTLQAPSDIAAVYTLIAELAPQVRLSPETSDFVLCQWRPDALLPPEGIDPENSPHRVLLLDVGDLIDFFDAYPDKRAKFEAYPGPLNRLTAYYEVRRSVDPLSAKTCGLIMGRTQSAKFLNILISRYRVMELSGTHQTHPQASSLELVPLEMRNTMASLSSKIFADVKNVSASQLTVFGTNNRALCVVKSADISRSKDEMAIIVQENKPPCFAVIRHIRTDSNIRLRNFLLERIEGEVYPVEIGKNQGFIIIRPESERAELFLPPENRHANTTVLAIARGIIDASIKIEKFLELNTHFARYEVGFC